jgi:hypothetical protein
MKIAGVVLLSIVAALTLVWFFLLRAPSPEVVCERLIALTVAEAGDRAPEALESLVDRLRLTCTRQKRDLLRLRGKYAYARHAECVLAAQSVAAAERC